MSNPTGQPQQSKPPPSESRELSLVSTVELRIASAATTKSQLQPLINTYLVPLLLKIGSPHPSVRARTREACQRIVARLGSASRSAGGTSTSAEGTEDDDDGGEIEIPVRRLVEQFRELGPGKQGRDGAGSIIDDQGQRLHDDVRRFALVFIRMGLSRLRFPAERSGRQKEVLELLKCLLVLPDTKVSSSPSFTSSATMTSSASELGEEVSEKREEIESEIRPRIREEDMSLDTRLYLYGLYSLLHVLPSPFFPLPDRNTKADSDLKGELDLTSAEANSLAGYLTKFLLADSQAFLTSAAVLTNTVGGDHAPNSMPQQLSRPSPLPGLTAADRAVFRYWIVRMKEQPQQQDRRAIEQVITSTKVAVAKFLFTAVFDDRQRFMPAVVMTADDTNLTVFRIGDTMFKQCNFNLEDGGLVNRLYELYFGRGQIIAPHRGQQADHDESREMDVDDGRVREAFQKEQEETQRTLPARPKLRVRILALLSKSGMAATKTSQILGVVKQQFGQVTDFGREATKSRAAAFNLLNWVSRIGSTADVMTIAAEVTAAFRAYIVDQGWPDPVKVTAKQMSGPELELRAKAYDDIGVWAARADFPQAAASEEEQEETTRLALVRFLLSSLSCDASSPDIQVSIDSALGRLLNVISESDNADAHMTTPLRDLLKQHMRKEVGDYDDVTGFKVVRSTRFSAVRLANRCLPFNDCAARWMDIVAIGAGRLGERTELVEEGAKGLDPFLWSTTNRSKAKTEQTTPTAAATTTSPLPPPPKFPRLVELVDYLFHGGNGEVMIEAAQRSKLYRLALPSGLSFCRNIVILEALGASGADKGVIMEPEWERKIEAVVSTDHRIRSSIRNHLRENVDLSALVALIDTALTGMSLHWDHCAETAVGLCSLAPDGVIQAVLHRSPVVQPVTTSNDLAIQSQAARLLGILASHPQFPKQGREELIGIALSAMQAWRTAIGQEINRTRGLMLCAASTLSRQALRQCLAQDELVPRYLEMMVQVILGSRDTALQSGGHICLGEIMLCVEDTAGFLQHLAPDALIEQLKSGANKGQESAVAALGRLIRGLDRGEESSQATAKALESLFSLHEMKRPEMQFAIGEALSVAAAGWHSSATAAEFDVDVPQPSRVVNQGMLDTILDRVISDINNTKPSLKKASAIWLLCLVQYVGKQPAVQSRLRQCQAAFANLLTNRDDMVQETGSRGLSVVYEMGDKNLKEDLVRELVASFTSGSVKMGGTVTLETELFEPGALPTGDGSVTTYKDIVSLASEMGDPSLVYRFMNLASNNAIWSSRSAFGRFGLGNVLADSSYLAENKNFYPKLYRYRFDPNPNVQRSMNEIWNALVKDPSYVIQQNFDHIIEDLLKGLVNGAEWRIRQASCAATAEILQGRDVDQYEKYLNEIWTKAFQVLDDIKETVRTAAMGLCRTLTNLLIRNLEVGSGTTRRGQKLLEYAMQFLLQQMQSGSAKEVLEHTIQTLLKVIKKSPPVALRAYAPAIIETLIASMTSLEPEAVNYIHLNAEKYGVSAEKLDSARVSGVSSSPAMRAVERCIEGLDEKGMSEVMKSLGDSFKSVIGLPSKVGLSSLLVTLVVRHGFEFRPYADRFAQLLRKHLFDRNETVINAYCLSLAYLMRLASDEEMVKTADFIKGLYFASEDTSHRQIAGDVLHAISKVSNDRFMAFGSTFLPFAFIGRNDVDTQVREQFQKTWENNVGGNRAVALYLMEIVDLAQHLDSPQWGIKHTISSAVGDLISNLDSVISGNYTHTQATAIWSLLEKALAGKTWEGKEKVVASLPKFVKKAQPLWESHRAQFETIAIREAKRTNPAYRTQAISALGEVVKILRSPNLAKKTLEVMSTIAQELTDGSEDRMEVDGDTGSLGLEKQRQAELDKTLAALIGSCSNATTVSNGDGQAKGESLKVLVQILDQSLMKGSRLSHTAAYEGLNGLFLSLTYSSRPETNGELEGTKSRVEKDNEERKTVMDLVRFLLPTISPTPSQRSLQMAESNDTEGLRLARARAVLAFTSGLSAFLRAQEKEDVLAAVKQWLEAERSGRVRDILNEASASLSTFESRAPTP